MKKVVIIVLVILLIGSFGSTGYLLYKRSQKPHETFETEQPFFTDIVKKTLATGIIVPRREIEIKSQVPGIVEKLFVKAGEKVEEGTTIAKIKIVPDVVALNQAENNLKTAQINFENSKKELERQKQLYEEAVISEMDYNEYLLNYKLRQQALSAAQNNLELIREGASKNSGTVSNIVKSTISGTILDFPVKEGNRIIESNAFNEGTTIAFIADMNDMIFEGKLDESEVGKIIEGMPITLKVGALENETYNAYLEFISPKGEKEEGATQFKIRAALTINENQKLRSGYSANAEIVLEKKDSVMAISEGLIEFEEEEAFVYVETNPEKFEKRKITTGISDGINIEVLSGVSAEEKLRKK